MDHLYPRLNTIMDVHNRCLARTYPAIDYTAMLCNNGIARMYAVRCKVTKNKRIQKLLDVNRYRLV